MKKKILLWIIIVPLVLMLALCGISNIYFSFFYYDPYSFPNSYVQPEKGSFIIDPETILDALKNGEPTAFAPYLEQQEDGEAPDVVFKEVINWKTKDYLMIAEAINQKVWKDTLKDWEIYSMVFSTDCQDQLSGFEEGYIVYFRTVSTDEEYKVYTVREFSIKPKYGYVSWGGGINASRPPLFGWKSIDLGRMIDASDALGIAEDNGGANIRLQLNNQCRIRLSLEPELYADGWDIWYRVDNLSEFEVSIDPHTGKVTRRWFSGD